MKSGGNVKKMNMGGMAYAKAVQLLLVPMGLLQRQDQRNYD